MNEKLITIELVEILWPKHMRTSCADDNLANSDPHHENGTPRCYRCMGLDNLGEPLGLFEIEAHIREKIDPDVLRARALEKLTHLERKALGL